MLYIRISLMVPLAGQAEAATDLLDAVANYLGGQPGYLGAYVLQPQPTTGMIGRVTLWEDEASADAVAQSAHMLSLRSELAPRIAESSHLEYGFNAERVPVLEPSLRLRSADALAAIDELLRGRTEDDPAAGH
jgi:heme-degrading monooxygenase HmoA